VKVLGVNDVIICGHSHCGAMDALLHPEDLDGMEAVKGWLKHADETLKIIDGNYQHITELQPRLTATVEENVLVQLEHLRTHPSVAEAVSRGDLKLHGWTYQFESGQVFNYDPKEGQFVAIQRSGPVPRFEFENIQAI